MKFYIVASLLLLAVVTADISNEHDAQAEAHEASQNVEQCETCHKAGQDYCIGDNKCVASAQRLCDGPEDHITVSKAWAKAGPGHPAHSMDCADAGKPQLGKGKGKHKGKHHKGKGLWGAVKRLFHGGEHHKGKHHKGKGSKGDSAGDHHEGEQHKGKHHKGKHHKGKGGKGDSAGEHQEGDHHKGKHHKGKHHKGKHHKGKGGKGDSAGDHHEGEQHKGKHHKGKGLWGAVKRFFHGGEHHKGKHHKGKGGKGGKGDKGSNAGEHHEGKGGEQHKEQGVEVTEDKSAPDSSLEMATYSNESKEDTYSEEDEPKWHHHHHHHWVRYLAGLLGLLATVGCVAYLCCRRSTGADVISAQVSQRETPVYAELAVSKDDVDDVSKSQV